MAEPPSAVPGFGTRVVAGLAFPRGRLLVRDKPLISMPPPEDDSALPSSTWLEELLDQYHAMSEDQHSAYNELCAPPASDSVKLHIFHKAVELWGRGLYSTDAGMPPLLQKVYMIFLGNRVGRDQERQYVFLRCSRFRHTGDPNAVMIWSSRPTSACIVAMRDIPKHTEVVISYTPEPLFKLAHPRRTCLVHLKQFICYGAAGAEREVPYLDHRAGHAETQPFPPTVMALHE